MRVLWGSSASLFLLGPTTKRPTFPEQMLPADVHELVRSIDADSDGFVSQADWLAWMAPVVEADGATAAATVARHSSAEASPLGPRAGYERADLDTLSIEQSTIDELHELERGRLAPGAGTTSPRCPPPKRGWFGF